MGEGEGALTVVPPGAVARDDDVGRVVSLAEDVVVRGHEVLQRGGEGVLRDGGETIARCNEHTFGGGGIPGEGGDRAEQLDVKLDKRDVGGVAGDVTPAVDEEDDTGVRGLSIAVAAEGVEIDGDALWHLERGTGEERVWLGGGRGDLDANRDVRGDALRIGAPSALVYGFGGGA